MSPLRKSLLPLLLAAALAGSLPGCGNLAYYAQAIGGHLDVMGAAQPIGDIMRDPAGDPALKRQLDEVLTIREFASRELGLPDNDSYRRYADLGRPYVVWNVFAAPEFSLQAKSWCMLLVGCVNYRGYYAREDAERLATQLRAEDYDTYVGGVPAYSTLGYFDDPVLNTFLRHGTLEVARTVFHELAHQLVFVKGDSSFNESFATTVENEGLRRWSAAHAEPRQRAAFAALQARRAAFARLMGDYRKQFSALYARPRADDEQRQAKAELLAAWRRDYADLKSSWGGQTGKEAPSAGEFNNARLVAFSLYHELVPAFDALLAQEHHDLPSFYRRVAALAALGKEDRCNALKQLIPASGAASLRQCSAPGTPEIH